MAYDPSLAGIPYEEWGHPQNIIFSWNYASTGIIVAEYETGIYFSVWCIGTMISGMFTEILLRQKITYIF